MIINLQVQHQRIQGVNKIPRLVIEGSRNFVFLELDFDEEWADLTTTVIFSNDHCPGQNPALLWTGKPLEIPEEMLVSGVLRISCVGVGDLGLHVTTKHMTEGIRIHRAGEQSGYTPGSSVPGLWEQVLASVGSLASLKTENKDSIVAAVNDIYGRGIRGIEQTMFAETDGGVNEFTIGLFDGTEVVLRVLNGNKGSNGKSPIIGENGNWYVYSDETESYEDTGSYSGGEAPFIGTNGNWWIGTNDTGVSATGPVGAPFTYDMFTPAQLAALKGEKGEPGKAFTYDMFTSAQLAALKGEQGVGIQNIDYDEGSGDFIITFTDMSSVSIPGPKLPETVVRIADVELLAARWQGSGNLYSQVVSIAGVTANSQIDLTPSVEQLVVFYEKDLGFVTENDDGTVTVYAIGQKPENDYTIQVTITEVQV